MSTIARMGLRFIIALLLMGNTALLLMGNTPTPVTFGGLATVAPAEAQTVGDRIDVSGTISTDTEWTADHVYVIRENLTVAAGVTLTVHAGTVVKLYKGQGWYRLFVDGTLRVEGAEAAPVVFTSLADDTWAGDTNADGAASTPQSADWGAISFRAGSRGRLQYALLRYGGGGYTDDPTKALVQSWSSDVTLDHVTLQDSWYYGVYANHSSVTVTSSAIANNRGYGLFYLGVDPAVPLTVSDNVFTATGGGAGRLVFDGQAHGAVVFRGNRTSDGRSGFSLDGTVNGEVQWDNAAALPLVIAIGDTNLAIAATGTLTLMPGTVVKLYKGPGWRHLVVDGTLRVEGAEAAPVVFTSLADDTWAGDTNADGTATAPQSADWGAISFRAGSRGRLQYALLRYGGGGFTDDGTKALVRSWSSDVTLDQAILEYSGFYAVYAENAGLLIQHSQILNNFSGIRNVTPKVVVDARHNWWGDASGPLHPTKNPNGTGNAVSDGVLFFPWAVDADGTVPTQVLVSGPATVSPGQTAEYAVSYYAGQGIDDAVIKLTLPAGAEYVDSGQGGVHWFDNREVFWRLNPLPAGSEGTMSVRVRFQWGLPSGLRGGVRALLDGSNVDAGAFDFATGPYYDYAPPARVEPVRLSRTEVEALIGARPDASAAYAAALAAGFTLVGGAHLGFDPSAAVTEALLIKSSAVQYLYWRGEDFLSVRLNPNSAVFEDAGGGMGIDSSTGAVSYSGGWIGGGGSAERVDREGCLPEQLHHAGQSAADRNGDAGAPGGSSERLDAADPRPPTVPGVELARVPVQLPEAQQMRRVSVQVGRQNPRRGPAGDRPTDRGLQYRLRGRGGAPEGILRLGGGGSPDSRSHLRLHPVRPQRDVRARGRVPL